MNKRSISVYIALGSQKSLEDDKMHYILYFSLEENIVFYDIFDNKTL